MLYQKEEIWLPWQPLWLDSWLVIQVLLAAVWYLSYCFSDCMNVLVSGFQFKDFFMTFFFFPLSGVRALLWPEAVSLLSLFYRAENLHLDQSYNRFCDVITFPDISKLPQRTEQIALTCPALKNTHLCYEKSRIGYSLFLFWALVLPIMATTVSSLSA